MKTDKTRGGKIVHPCWRCLKWIAALAAMLGLPTLAQADLTIAGKGAGGYRIVIAAEAPPSERYAAEELRQYLQKMSGASLAIVTDSEPVQSREILLGDNSHLRGLKKKIDFTALGREGFVLRTDGDKLIIAGGKPRGTLYGVYALLEEKLGVRWFTPELESVPKRDRVKVPKLSETVIPALEYREDFWTETLRDPDFAARHRLNGNHDRLTEKHGGRGAVYYPFVHSMDMLVPQELYAEHPEYFPLVNGKRINGYVQRCLSNPDVVKIALEDARQWLKEHPEANIISISQNDTFNYCQCDKCKAVDDVEGSPSGSMIRFVNAVAENLEPDFPHVMVDTLAYQYTRKPPRTLRPRRNVVIRLCSIECCFAHPLDQCSSAENQRFGDDIKAWEPISPRLYIWNYTPNFAHYEQPFPNWDALQPNLQFFVKHGVKGVFEEGNSSPGGLGEMAPLRAYVLAELLWDPDTDVQKHINEFLAAYYGKAAGDIRAYLDLLERQVRQKGFHARIYDPPGAPYLNDELINGAGRLFDHAEQVADDDTIRFRVQVARLPVWYVQLAANRVTGAARTDLLRQFLAVARKAGITNISEGGSLADWAKSMGAE
jgi:hypothetical protein